MSARAKASAAAALLVALFWSTLAAAPAGDGVRERVIAAGTVHKGDLTSFGNPVNVSGTVEGSVQVVGDSASIGGHVTGDVVVFGGSARLMPGAAIDGDVVCIGGSVTGAEQAHLGGALFAPGSLGGGFQIAGQRTAHTLDERPLSLISIALKLSLLLAWLIAAVVVTLLSGREVRASSIELRTSAFHTFVLGLVAFTSFVLTAIVFSYLIPFIVGIPLIAALAIFALLTKVFGLVAVFHAIGTLVAGARTRSGLGRRRWLRGDLAMVVIGLLILGAIRMIPVVGSMVWMIASIHGIGSALETKFGRREPWFLAVQPVR